MKTQIVNEDPKNPVLMIATDEDAKISYNFVGKKAEFYQLYIQIREILKIEPEEQQ